MVLHKIDLQHCSWYTQQYYFLWCAEIVNRNVRKAIKSSSKRTLTARFVIPMPEKALLFLNLWALNFHACHNMLTPELFIW